jgi:hypothetical protein
MPVSASVDQRCPWKTIGGGRMTVMSARAERDYSTARQDRFSGAVAVFGRKIRRVSHDPDDAR